VNCCRKLKIVLAGSLAVLALRPESLLACAACYGQSDSPLAQGLNWGIFTLLGVVVCVLGGITMFFVHISQRSGAAAPADPASVEPPAQKG
jgi:hypothetical protein